MDLQAWNIVLTVTIGVLVIGYGFWLKNVIDQQLKAKDTAIQALEAALKSREAEISVLRSDTAPAITKAYKGLREYANGITEESEHLRDELGRVKAKMQTAPVSVLLAETGGLLAAGLIIDEKLGTILFPGGKAPELSPETFIAFGNGFLDTQRTINSEVNGKIEEVKKLMGTIRGMDSKGSSRS